MEVKKKESWLDKQKCLQCGKPLGAEVFLGAVCGACCKANHRKAIGKR